MVKIYPEQFDAFVVMVVNWSTFETEYITAVGMDKLNKVVDELCQRRGKIDFAIYRRVNFDFE